MHKALLAISFYGLIGMKTALAFIELRPGLIQGFETKKEEHQRLLASFNLISEVFRSLEFQDRIVNFKGKGRFGGFTSNKGMTNQQIYDFIMQGRELINGESSLGEMNFDIRRYVPWYPSRVIGRTFPGRHNVIEVNGQHYSKFTSVQMASNITHEWTHLVGFSHENKDDKDSVPYAVGDIMADLASKYVDQGFLR